MLFIAALFRCLPAAFALLARRSRVLALATACLTFCLPHLLCHRQLRDAVQAATLSPECALANAALVPDLLVLHAAAYKALAAQKRGALRTRGLHAELVFNLSGSKHVRGLGGGGDGGLVLMWLALSCRTLK